VKNAQVEKLLELVSPRVGVVRSLTRVSRGVGEPSPPILYHAMLSNFDFKKAAEGERATAGKGVTDSDAMAGAIGEAIERYCAYHPAIGSIRRLRRRELDHPSISPPECVLYSSSQYARRGFPYAPWNEEAPTGWLPARQLPGQVDIYIPAFLTYLNYTGPAGEDHYCPPTSNGLAAGPDLESAILSALFELAERDGFLVHWMNQLPAPEVEFEGGIADDIRRHYQRFGAETRVFNVSTGLPMHVMMAVLLGDGRRTPAALVGLGCHLDPRVAVNKALFEICQIRPGETRRFVEERACDKLHGYADVHTLMDHSAFFHVPERRVELGFLLDHGRKQRLDELPNRSTVVHEDLATAVEGLVRAGCRVAYADVTTADVREYRIRVVRAIASGLQPMHFGYGEDRLGGRRLFDLPRQLGYAAQSRLESELNPCPHPLA
jgi:ribosomal protein S12 methylthiotransferase accessory factor